MDPCCGTGQLTPELLRRGFEVTAFDVDYEMVETINLLYPELKARQMLFRDFKGIFNQ
ncbi:MAG: methyltransferase domain-containing protein, partial [Prevotellaceae bacterium]|nr:methyltransferase domain-containing protein [Prevotellaceae bacterium]